jgi:hypothetical protein
MDGRFKIGSPLTSNKNKADGIPDCEVIIQKF